MKFVVRKANFKRYPHYLRAYFGQALGGLYADLKNFI